MKIFIFMKNNVINYFLFLFLCLNITIQTNAQTINDIESAVTQGEQFEDVQELSANREQMERDGSVIAGEPGVFILNKIDIFSIGAALGGGYSTNPKRNFDTNGEGSFFANAAISAGVNTRINSSFDTGINLIVSGTEYEKDGNPSNRNLVGSAYVAKAFLDRRLYISANITTGLAMDSKFKNSTAFYGASLSASSSFPLSDNLIWRPGVTLSRQWSGQSEQNNIAGTISSDLSWFVAPSWIVNGRLSYTHKIYDDFFEDVTFVVRKDNSIRGSLTLIKQFSTSTTASVSVEYTRQDSRFFISEFRSFDGGLYARFNHRF